MTEDEDIEMTVFDFDDSDDLKRFEVIDVTPATNSVRRPQLVKSPPKLTRIKCWPEVESRLKAGITPSVIAKYIQEDCQEYLHIDHDSLTSVLSWYRRNKIPAGEIAQHHLPEFAAKALAKLEAGINEVTELHKMHALNSVRLETAMEQEASMGFLNPNVTNAMKLSQSLLQTSAEIKVNMGIPLEDTQSQKDSVLQNVGSQVSEVLKNNASRNKLLDILKRAKKLKNLNGDDLEQATSVKLLADK